MAEKTVTELTVSIVDDYGDDIDSDDPCVETKHTILNDVGYITAKFESGRVFSIHVREVKPVQHTGIVAGDSDA